ncbi:MAG: hypothetical protein ACLP1X_32495 [Polyangiaceae bacterium]|jgi:hypothetical protein
MNHAGCRATLLVLALVSSALLAACGGKSADTLNEPGDAEASPDANQPVVADATSDCAALPCPTGSNPGLEDGECACLPVDSGIEVDATDDAPVNYSYPDVSQVPNYPDASYADAFAPYTEASVMFDAQVFQDAPAVPDSGFFCSPYLCGNGYVPDQYCDCIPCDATCPLGQTPGPGCNGCVACNYTCPAGFDYGAGCGCVPHGVDAGILPGNPVDGGNPGGGDGGGIVCLIEGYTQCSASSWCELGVCPDNTTQYGCYCSADGTATCDVNCPQPPPCTIPGEGTCPYGSQCVFGSCSDPSNSVFVCSCNSGGTAYCNTSSCADGGPFIFDSGAPGDGGVTCLLEGQVACSAGSFCSLGTCPDGTTQYGCTCNQDGTATCNLTCPPPPPCEIPGEGTCPYGSQCVFGTCNGNVGTLLSCYCEYGGGASCYTSSCGATDGGVAN